VVSAKTGDQVEWKKRGAKETELLGLDEVIEKVK
jgi:hypothetical protein